MPWSPRHSLSARLRALRAFASRWYMSLGGTRPTRPTLESMRLNSSRRVTKALTLGAEGRFPSPPLTSLVRILEYSSAVTDTRSCSTLSACLRATSATSWARGSTSSIRSGPPLAVERGGGQQSLGPEQTLLPSSINPSWRLPVASCGQASAARGHLASRPTLPSFLSPRGLSTGTLTRSRGTSKRMPLSRAPRPAARPPGRPSARMRSTARGAPTPLARAAAPAAAPIARRLCLAPTALRVSMSTPHAIARSMARGLLRTAGRPTEKAPGPGSSSLLARPSPRSG
mmetsp:Transcript_66388/g.210049  ORF Transcript_66388/g.210049 Transcript_66388/m.210049 type:complete len:286 (+) Transcript_66388:2245-3102(+)